MVAVAAEARVVVTAMADRGGGGGYEGTVARDGHGGEGATMVVAGAEGAMVAGETAEEEARRRRRRRHVQHGAARTCHTKFVGRLLSTSFERLVRGKGVRALAAVVAAI